MRACLNGELALAPAGSQHHLIGPKCLLDAKLSMNACKIEKQQMAAGAALPAKRGKRSKSSLKGASRSMYKRSFAEWPRPGERNCPSRSGVKEGRFPNLIDDYLAAQVTTFHLSA